MQNIAGEATKTKGCLSQVEHADHGLTLYWDDGFESFFHFIWLRDCCYCDSCGDVYSSKRFLVPSDIPLDIRPESAEISDNGELVIVWCGDQHCSRYHGDWLRRWSYDDESRLARFHQPILWDAKIKTGLPRVEFQSARDSDSARMTLYGLLRDYGFVIVSNGGQSPGSIEQVANLIGDLGDSAYSKIFDLTPAAKIRTMGNTTRPVPPHTDEAFRYSPPGINVLGCVHPADDGGDSVLVDGFHLARLLREQDSRSFELLSRYSQVFQRTDGCDIDQRARQRMFALDDRGEVVGVRIHTRSAGPLDLPTNLIEAHYAAHHRVSQMMMSLDNQARFRLEAGDSVIFDNHRVLHARTDFTDTNRFLQICNVSREDFHQRLRLLARRLDLQAEADMVLASGVAG